MITVTISTRPCYWIADDAKLSAAAADALATLLADLTEDKWHNTYVEFQTSDCEPSFDVVSTFTPGNGRIAAQIAKWAAESWSAAIEVARDIMAGA